MVEKVDLQDVFGEGRMRSPLLALHSHRLPHARLRLMTSQPTYLLADSQLLFWSDGGRPFLQPLRDGIRKEQPKAAYIGVSTADQPEFYTIFRSAMDLVGITDCHMISSEYHAVDQENLGSADIILLGGGDVRLGWQVMTETGMGQDIRDKHKEDGAVLLGVSAGAVHLGLKGWNSDDISPGQIFDSLGVVPFVFDVHDEGHRWSRLKSVVSVAGPAFQGIGLPAGSGVIHHPDATLEPVRKAVPHYLRIPTK